MFFACLKIAVGAGGLTVVVIVIVTAPIHQGVIMAVAQTSLDRRRIWHTFGALRGEELPWWI